MYYKITIDETGRGNLREEARRFNTETAQFRTLEAVQQFIIDRYGKIPKRTGRNTIYRDPDAQPVGFLYSYWNKDYSHNSESWYQTDWVTVTSVTEEPILVS